VQAQLLAMDASGALERAIELLSQGEAIAFPTDASTKQRSAGYMLSRSAR
jgi:hypothetical protein